MDFRGLFPENIALTPFCLGLFNFRRYRAKNYPFLVINRAKLSWPSLSLENHSQITSKRYTTGQRELARKWLI